MTESIQRNGIVSLISSYVQLEQNGDHYVGLCPFHQETTPSFHVIPSLQVFHCFGCKTSGDMIAFLMQREHMTFCEALVNLAERAGLTSGSSDD